jgi:hypothetical protein
MILLPVGPIIEEQEMRFSPTPRDERKQLIEDEDPPPEKTLWGFMQYLVAREDFVGQGEVGDEIYPIKSEISDTKGTVYPNNTRDQREDEGAKSELINPLLSTVTSYLINVANPIADTAAVNIPKSPDAITVQPSTRNSVPMEKTLPIVHNESADVPPHDDGDLLIVVPDDSQSAFKSAFTALDFPHSDESSEATLEEHSDEELTTEQTDGLPHVSDPHNLQSLDPVPHCVLCGKCTLINAREKRRSSV